MKYMRLIFFVPFMQPLFVTSANTLWEMKEPQGFHWYKDPKHEIWMTPNRNQHSHESTHESPHKKTYTQRIAIFSKALEEAKAKAVLRPSFENVSLYKALQEKAIDHATDFSKMWLFVNLIEGGLRPEDNTDNQFRKLYDAQEERRLDHTIRQAAKSYGLFFFFKKACPYCHRFAPIVKLFADRYGFEVKAVSQEGSTLPEFPQSVKDQGIGNVLNPEHVFPSLFLAHPKTYTVMPLAWGMVSEDQLRLNIKHLLNGTQKGA